MKQSNLMTERIHIYRVYFPTSGKCYIGQTKDLLARMESHIKSGSLVCKALWKYDDWQWLILHTCHSRNDANKIEIEEIRNFNSVAPNGYNLTHGGEGGTPSKETRIKLSAAQKGNKKGRANKGRVISEDQRAKISSAMLGRESSEAAKNKISKSLIGNKRAPKKNPSVAESNKNRVWSRESRAKISMASSGKKQPRLHILKRRITTIRRLIKKLGGENE